MGRAENDFVQNRVAQRVGRVAKMFYKLTVPF